MRSDISLHELVTALECQREQNPTAEMIAVWFFQRNKDCESLRVYENDECWAEVKV
jgi:hypothetical protein